MKTRVCLKYFVHDSLVKTRWHYYCDEIDTNDGVKRQSEYLYDIYFKQNVNSGIKPYALRVPFESKYREDYKKSCSTCRKNFNGVTVGKQN